MLNNLRISQHFIPGARDVSTNLPYFTDNTLKGALYPTAPGQLQCSPRDIPKGDTLSNKNKRLTEIVKTAETYFKEPVLSVTAPGGKGRSSYRLNMANRSMIGTLRPNFRRTHLEAYVLQNLGQYSDDIPACLGLVGNVLFQSDVGEKRLNVEISRLGLSEKIDLADQAVAAIFRYQSAARRTRLHERLPHLGVNEAWVGNFVNAADALAIYKGEKTVSFDRTAACRIIAQPGVQFVKWDCRSGNAALDQQNRLRWFDFEYSGMRHGAEDFAWLLGDEAWPLPAQTMLDLVKSNFDPENGHGKAEYFDFLSLYIVFHCIQRLKLIVKEAKKRGWLSKHKVLRYDDAGVHPEFAAHISTVGSFFSERNTITAPLVSYFEAAEKLFGDMLGNASAA